MEKHCVSISILRGAILHAWCYAVISSNVKGNAKSKMKYVHCMAMAALANVFILKGQ